MLVPRRPRLAVLATLLLAAVLVALPRPAGAAPADPSASDGSVLARPTDGRRDPFGDGYRTRARRTCGPHVCVHWVPRTSDAPPGQAWVRRTLAVMEKVWRTEVGQLGYRAPRADGTRGGDRRLDVYLHDLGSAGAYGYCTTEATRPATSRATAAGYCVLDNDFDPAQYAGAPAIRSLKVTAAHEFFHAVQFAYDADPDPWFAESTAVWMEGQVFPGAHDNLQYLPYGQLAFPGRPLDRFQPIGFTHYGNWVFWQRLSDRFGPRIVRRTWERSAAGAYSSRALQDVVAPRRGGLADVLAEYGASLTDPARIFRDGDSWPTGRAPDEAEVSAATPRLVLQDRLDHLTTHSHLFRPDPGIPGTDRLQLKVRAPSNPATGPGAWVRVLRADGRVRERAIDLNRRGRGQVMVGFASGEVQSVTVTLANASTRFACHRRTTLSCQGRPLDNNRRFRLTATLR